MPQNLPPGNRVPRQPQSRHPDAMCSVEGEPNRERVADGRLVDEQPVGVDDEHPGDEQPVGEGDVRPGGGHPGDGKGGLHPAANRVEPAR